MISRRLFFFLLTTCAVLAQPLFAEEPPPAAAGAPAAGDVEHAVLLDESRPLFLRFGIGADGKGFRALWREYV